MDIRPNLTLTQKQQLRLSPQLIQSFELMAMPLSELQQRIKAEVETNPALELPASWDFSYDRVAREKQQREARLTDDSYSDSSAYGSDRGGYDTEATERQSRFLEGALSRRASLGEHLLTQLGYEHLSDEEYEVGAILITGLDANGFFTSEPEALLSETQRAHLPKMLAVLARLEPAGIGVRCWRESLIAQAAQQGMEGEELETFSRLVNEKLELMRSGKSEQVAKELGIDAYDLEVLYTFLKTLTPFPGQSFSSGPEQFVIPELSIRRDGGELVMQMNDHALPDLRIQASFEHLADHIGDEEEAKKATAYINEQIKRAESLLFQIEVRNKTLYRLGQVLMKRQREFFLSGPLYIKPLTQKEVAAELGVHETTVSRISTAKWVDTDWGLIQVKGLFSSAVGEEGALFSKEAVKEMIRRILDDHQGAKALSDQKISDILKEEGVSVARRTVAKYRNELNIDPSFIRGTN
ncbi:MAG: RNA polymerase factor sigma-54 [Sphaerochaeta sp.]|jgi:RNA polymerase sigma-54 factor|nr:RNA polymerase factor sigma-54 [Sphaerochaeta sp.]MDX9914264.1 RNA polymerase factor sigma-54 [Sphaerochaeta sp.]